MNSNDFIKNAKDDALTIGGVAFDSLKASWKLSAAKKKLAQAQADEMYNRIMQNRYWPDYNNVANALGQCLSSYHSQLGLCRPSNAVDIYCNRGDMSISVGSQIIFRYEVNRLVSDLYEGGMRKYEYPRVPHEDIEKKLNQVLPKYVNAYGYTCSTLKVTDHEEDTVLITLNGVRLI